MQSLSHATRGACRRRNSGRVGCAPPLRWPPALAQRDAPLMAAASSLPKRHLDPVSRFAYGPWSMQRDIGARWEKWQGRQQMVVQSASVSTESMDTGMRQKTDTKCMNEEEPLKFGTDVTDDDSSDEYYIWIPTILPHSSHRDGLIYKSRSFWKSFDIDIMDRDETPLEPMMLSEGTKRCAPDPENCITHFTCSMLQVFSMELVKSPIDNYPVPLYGYIAVRDDRDYMLNYVFNCSRDDPIIVQQGGPIKMTGPKRGIEMICPAIMEFDMRVKSGEQEDEDLQLIDGVIVCSENPVRRPVKNRLCGSSGSVDITLAVVEHAVEATIEVVISHVKAGFSLSLNSFIEMTDEYEEIQLFNETIGESCALRRFVVAVTIDTFVLFQLKVGDSNDEHFCYFFAKRHGCDSRQIKFEVACVSMKVTWSTIE